MPLKRSLGLFEVTLYGVGMIIGAGIYVLIGKVAGLAGYGIWLSFLLSSFIAIFTGLSYAELSSIFKEDGAEYVYVRETIQKEYLAYLAGWFVLFGSIISASVVALGFAGYMSGILNINYITPIAIGMIFLLTYINYRGINLSAKVNDIATFLEIGGLLFLIIGISAITLKENISIPDFTSFHIGGVLNGVILAFFAYLGFGSIAKISEEVKNPGKTVPLAIILSILITTLLYVSVALISVIAVPPEELAKSNEPASLIASKIHPSSAFLLSIIALFSTGNTLLLILVSSSRMLYGLSKYGVFPRCFTKISKSTSTPYLAVLMVGLISAILSLFKKIEIVASVTNIWVFIAYIFVNLSVIFLRIKERPFKGFRAPMNIGKFPVFAVLGIISSLIMIIYHFAYTHTSIKHPDVYLTILLITAATIYYLYKRKTAITHSTH